MRYRTLILVLLVMLFFTDCTNHISETALCITDEEVSALYFEAKSLLSELLRGTLDLDFEEPVTINDLPYYKVTDPKYETYDAFLSTLHTYFTDDYIDELLLSLTPSYTEYNGLLYAVGAQSGSNPLIGEDHVTNVCYANDEIVLTVSSEQLNDALETNHFVEHTFHIQYEDGQWKFRYLYLTN